VNIESKFGVQVGHSKSQPSMTNYPVRDVVTSRDPFLNFSPPKISLERLKLETSNFVHWLAMSNISLRTDESSIKWAWSRSRDLLKFWEIIDNISETVQERDTVTLKTYRKLCMAYPNVHKVILVLYLYLIQYMFTLSLFGHCSAQRDKHSSQNGA